jgi:hypothetical protein
MAMPLALRTSLLSTIRAVSRSNRSKRAQVVMRSSRLVTIPRYFELIMLILTCFSLEPRSTDWVVAISRPHSWASYLGMMLLVLKPKPLSIARTLLGYGFLTTGRFAVECTRPTPAKVSLKSSALLTAVPKMPLLFMKAWRAAMTREVCASVPTLRVGVLSWPLLVPHYALTAFARQSYRDGPYYPQGRIVLVETVGESTVSPAADVSETGATYNDVETDETYV